VDPARIPRAWRLHPEIRDAGSVTNAARVNHHSNSYYYDLAIATDAERQNLAYSGNGFKANYPYVYETPEGPRAEYICAEDAAKLVGETVPLTARHVSTKAAVPDDVVIGEYTITAWDDERGQEVAAITVDDERANEVLASVYGDDAAAHLLAAGEISTGYTCDIAYDAAKDAYVQKNFRLHHVALVPRGRCTAPACRITPAGEQ
jgi:hypothetical protein